MTRAFTCLLLAASALRGDDGLVLEARIVDERTGEPVVTAQVHLYQEWVHPGPGPRKPLFTARADATGRVRITRNDLPAELRNDPRPWDWAYVEAAGYAPNAMYASSAETGLVELRQPVDVDVFVRDPLNRPIERAQLSWILGCGHAPDARGAVTDADGTGRLRGIQVEGKGQVWVVAEGVLSEYVDLDGLKDGRVRHTAGWAYTVTGRILTHEGVPARDVAVGGHESHRGPWTRTDSEGKFRLAGLVQAPGEFIHIEPFDARVPVARTDGPSYAVAAPPSDIPLVFRLPAPGGEPEEEPAGCRIVVDLRAADGATPEAELGLLAVRDADGLTIHGDRVEETGLGWIDVPPGDYVVLLRLHSDNLQCLAERRSRVSVLEGGGAYVRIVPPRARWVALQRMTGLPDDVEASLVADGWWHRFDVDALDGPKHFSVPPDRPVFLRVEGRGDVSLVPLRSAEEEEDAEVFEIVTPKRR